MRILVVFYFFVLFAAIGLDLRAQIPSNQRGAPPNQEGVLTTTTLPACTSLPVVIDSHRCIHVVKGTPHFDSGTPVTIIVQEDRR